MVAFRGRDSDNFLGSAVFTNLASFIQLEMDFSSWEICQYPSPKQQNSF